MLIYCVLQLVLVYRIEIRNISAVMYLFNTQYTSATHKTLVFLLNAARWLGTAPVSLATLVMSYSSISRIVWRTVESSAKDIMRNKLSHDAPHVTRWVRIYQWFSYSGDKFFHTVQILQKINGASAERLVGSSKKKRNLQGRHIV